MQKREIVILLGPQEQVASAMLERRQLLDVTPGVIQAYASMVSTHLILLTAWKVQSRPALSLPYVFWGPHLPAIQAETPGRCLASSLCV